MKKLTKEQAGAFNYLNNLRDSGVTNMYGACPYLERDLKLDRRESREVLSLWMINFDGDREWYENDEIKD